MNGTTPAIVAQSAVRRLPRVALFLLCLAYIVPGLIGRGPWKSADVSAFGFMAEMAAGARGWAGWFNPLLLLRQPESPALLPYWIGAAAIDWAPAWLGPDLAVRLMFGLLLAGSMAATWYGVYYLARSPRAQPVAFAFGGEANPKDYARAIADGGLLALIACLGLAQLGHETTPALAQLFFTAWFFYGMAALPFRRVAPRLGVLGGLTGITLSGAPTVALLLGAGALALHALDGRRLRALQVDSSDEFGNTSRDARKPPGAVFTLAVAMILAVACAWSLNLVGWRVDLPGSHPGVSLWIDLRSQAKLLLWFTWPAWPLAIWTLWRWRLQLTARHVALPLLFAGVPLAATLLTSFSERSLLLGLPAIATLAAFALPTFRRSAAALIDWFTLLFFSGMAIFIWVMWVAIQTGFPAKPAANVARLAPGFVAEFYPVTFMLAIVATFAWCWLVKWRTGRHRSALWKTLVLPAGGATLCWFLMMTLWLQALDYARSYAPQVSAIAERIGLPVCVSELGLDRSQVAAMRFHGHFNLEPLTVNDSCPWLLVNPELLQRLRHVITLGQWRLIGTFRRPTSASDDLFLFQRLSAASLTSPPDASDELAPAAPDGSPQAPAPTASPAPESLAR